MVNNPKRIAKQLKQNKNIAGLTDSLNSMEKKLTEEKSTFFSTRCIDYKTLIYVLEQNGWESHGKNRFELVDGLFGYGHIKKIHNSSVLFFSKGKMIGFLGFRPCKEKNRSFLYFTVVVWESNH